MCSHIYKVCTIIKLTELLKGKTMLFKTNEMEHRLWQINGRKQVTSKNDLITKHIKYFHIVPLKIGCRLIKI